MQIEKPATVWKVEETEYERGWGQKPWGEAYYTTKEEAEAHCEKLFNDFRDPEWFVRGRVVKM